MLARNWTWAGLGALALLALSPPASGQTFGDTADVVAVEVPVQVLRDGQPVRGLSAADFEVFQGREKQELTGFEAIDLARLPPPGERPAVVPVAGRRHFLLLFDLSFSEPKSIVKARAAARDTMLHRLHPSDLVAVGTYSASRGPQLALGFTSDRRQVEAAIESLGLPELVDRSPDPLRLMAAELSEGNIQSSQGGSEGSQERKQGFNEILVEQLERAARAAERSDRDNRRDGITALARSVSDLARQMAAVAGRKYVVYLSEGFDGSLLTGVTTKETVEEMNDAVQSGEYWKVGSEDRFGGGRASSDLARMLEQLRRADCVIQAVDIGGLRAQGGEGGTRPPGEDALFMMADGTGGELYRSFNDLGEAMGRMLERTGVTYLLSFQPSVPPDGAYHPIEVRLKKAKRELRGMRIVHRPGYYAPVPLAREDPLTRTLRMADAVLGGEERQDFPAAVLAVPFAGEGGKAFVPVLIEAGGGGLLAGHRGASLPAEIYAYALDAAGQVGDFFAQSLELDVARTEGKLQQGGLKFYGHLELPAGEYSLRVLVRNAATGATSLRVAALAVPAFGTAPVLLPPLFPEVPGRWLVVRETPRGAQPQAPYPFLMRESAFMPASRPALGAGGEAVVALVGYNLGEGELAAEADVLDLAGRRLASGAISLHEREAAAPGAPERLIASFRAPELAPGEYLLRVRLTGAPAATAGPAAPGAASGDIRFVIN